MMCATSWGTPTSRRPAAIFASTPVRLERALAKLDGAFRTPFAQTVKTPTPGDGEPDTIDANNFLIQ
jgi:hypothetical protein